MRRSIEGPGSTVGARFGESKGIKRDLGIRGEEGVGDLGSPVLARVVEGWE